MKRKGLLLAALTVSVSGFVAADGSAQDVASLVAQLRAGEAETRRSAFYSLLGGRVPDAGRAVIRVLESHPSEREQITVALIEALHTESVRLRAFPQTMTEADGQYYGDLVRAVGSLRDARAVDALIRALGTGRLAAQGLAHLGPVALQRVLEELRESPHELVRGGAVQALGLMAGGDLASRLDREDLRVIRAELLRGLDDGSGHVRAMAARALIHFSDPEVREVMEHLANTDPYTRPPDGGTFYPVREAAREWLERHRGDGGTPSLVRGPVGTDAHPAQGDAHDEARHTFYGSALSGGTADFRSRLRSYERHRCRAGMANRAVGGIGGGSI